MFIDSPEGSRIAERKLKSIQAITYQLNQLNIKRTFFICGMFLESMCTKFGDTKLASAFDSDNSLVEIGDHTYSHQVLKNISTRPDKVPIDISEIEREFNINSLLFKRVFEREMGHRGYRAPLGYFEGLKSNPEIVSTLQDIGVSYVSSDLRDERDSICPELLLASGKPRQPYQYSKGLLEIPSAGWQDTVFSGTTKTELFKTPPSDYPSIIMYYRDLFTQAQKIASDFDISYFLALVFHPYDVSIYNNEGGFFFELAKISQEIGGEFISYEEIKSKFLEDRELH